MTTSPRRVGRGATRIAVAPPTALAQVTHAAC